jgi:ATP-binding cassette subfamily B protein
MAAAVTVKLLGAVADLFIPLLMAQIIDRVLPLGSAIQVLRWTGLMAFCSLLAFLGNASANRMSSLAASRVVSRLRRDMFDCMLRLDCGQIEGLGIPSLVSRLTSDTYNLHKMLDKMMRAGIRAPILALGGLIITLRLNWRLALVLLATLPFLAAIAVVISKKGIPLFARLQEAVDVMVRVVRENCAGIRSIKAMCKSEAEKARFAAANERLTQRETQAAVVMAISQPASSFLLNGGLVAVILTGAVLAQQGLSEPGTLLAFMTYFTIILNAFLTVTRLFAIYSRGIASAGRIAALLEQPLEQPSRSPEQPSRSPTAAPDREPGGQKASFRDEPQQSDSHITFAHVSFTYPGQPAPALDDVSFSLGRGETLGVLGATGSGKSTLIHLLLRFYPPDSGVIRLRGQDSRDLPAAELYAMFGVVFQHDAIFAGSAADSIAFGRDLPGAALEKAAEDAQAGDFLAALPGKLGAPLLSKGRNLSGGQRQRLLVARALAGQPEILILDDSSSALDYRTDAALRDALRRRGRTTALIVSQRVSSVCAADRILVLDQGRVVGWGNHGELSASCRIYQEISQSQMFFAAPPEGSLS